MGMNSSHIALTIITYYPKWYPGKLENIADTDKVRGDLALEFIRKALLQDYKIVLVDGKSSESFKKELLQFLGITIIKRRGYKRSPAKRQAFKTASKIPNIKVIIAVEAEKVSFLDSIPLLINPILQNSVDIVIPKREEKLFFQSYPDYMLNSEREGNRSYNKQLKLYKLLPENGKELDMFFGPRVFANAPKVLSVFMKKFNFELTNPNFPKEYFDPEELSDTQYFPIVLALKKGLRVKSIEIPFKYPITQKENELARANDVFLEKRKGQHEGLLVELEHLLKHITKHHN